MIGKLIVMLSVFLFASGIGGCSVGMAASGRPDPNLSVLRVGATQGEVELQLGGPIATTQANGGNQTNLYEYKMGAEASPGRAVAHGVLDVLTLGLWEVVGTPVEATQLGTKYRVSVTYDANGRVIAVNEPAREQAPPAPRASDAQPGDS